MNNNQKSSVINFRMILILLLIIIAGTLYWYKTKDSLSETYKIKSAGGESGYKASYINRTGKEVEDKKIELSDDYWTSGKFGF